jgi:hypothetical protein
MSDDTSKKGMRDRTRINTSEIACRAPSTRSCHLELLPATPGNDHLVHKRTVVVKVDTPPQSSAVTSSVTFLVRQCGSNLNAD